VKGSKEAVGLHFAGETDSQPDQEHALACHLPRVLGALNISLSTVEKEQVMTTKHRARGRNGNGHDRELMAWMQDNRDRLAELLRIVDANSTPALGASVDAGRVWDSPH
jgi:hypothetical protein